MKDQGNINVASNGGTGSALGAGTDIGSRTQSAEPVSKMKGDVKISFGEKLSYALGDGACNVVVGLTSSLLTFFYTDYMGISAATIGIIMLVSRIFDGGSDVVMGLIMDRTKSKHGKARSWILRMMLPFAIGTVLLFTLPAGATATAKAIYIFITYNFMTTVVYTAINLPYGALASLMTRNQHERAVTNVMRMGISPIVRMGVTAATLPLVQMLGDTQKAWISVASIYGILALIMFWICFHFTEERVVVEAEQEQKVPVKESFKALVSNKYWFITMGLWGLQSSYIALVGMSTSYYCKYILNNINALSLLTLAENIPIVLIVLFLAPAGIKKYGKRNFSLAGITLALVGSLIMFINPYSLNLAIVSAVIRGIGQAPFHACIFSFIADSVEYGQWKTHIRQEGMIFSASSVGNKLGAGLISALIGGLLSIAGYNGMLSVQTPEAINTIKKIFLVGPVAMWVAILILLVIYQLDKEYPQIMKDLVEREGRGEI